MNGARLSIATAMESSGLTAIRFRHIEWPGFYLSVRFQKINGYCIDATIENALIQITCILVMPSEMLMICMKDAEISAIGVFLMRQFKKYAIAIRLVA